MREFKLNHNCIIEDVTSSVSLSLFFLSFVSRIYFKAKSSHPPSLSLPNTHTHTHSDVCRQTINGISGCDWRAWCWWTHRVAYRFARRSARDWQLCCFSSALTLALPGSTGCLRRPAALQCRAVHTPPLDADFKVTLKCLCVGAEGGGVGAKERGICWRIC